MSGLETLLPLLYHEKQQPGSRLCAQHALNAILQGDYFSAPDLAQFASQLDTLEGSFNDDAGPVSNNMDDTGFFSVQVLEGALRVWGLTLVRWRSQDLRHQQHNPHHQMAFILNHQQHWFSLRRFGSLENPENGHWFNLNSFLKEPEWVGKLYLGMVLSQAEDEGYSVFAVLPVSEGGDVSRTLPHTEADDVASTLRDPTSSHMSARLSTSHTLGSTNVDASSSKSPAPPSGFEDEDLELQAALQASLMGTGRLDYAAFMQRSSETRTTSSELAPPTRTAQVSEGQNPVNDPVAASMARNKAIMQRMLREQEMALREGYDEEVAGFRGANGIGMRRTDESSQVHEAQTAGGMAEADEEEEAVRRAIEESRTDGTRADADDQGSMDVSDDDAEWRPPQQRVPPSLSTASGDRVYDDEDSELQAALKASLEGLPEGFVVPPTPPQAIVPVMTPSIPSEVNVADVKEEEKPPIEIDAEEMRRRRLAHFSG